MGSFKGYGRPEQPSRRRSQKTPKRNGLPRIEFLEDRRLLSGGRTPTIPAPLWTPTSTNLFDAQNGPMANLGVGSVNVYKAYVQSGGNTSQLAAEFPHDRVQERDGRACRSRAWAATSASSSPSSPTSGMQITTSSAYYGLVDGYAPVNELPTIAELAADA